MELEVNDLAVQRQELELLFSKSRFAQIGRVEGIKIVKRRQEIPDNDCCSFAIGLPWGKALNSKLEEILASPSVEVKQKGDYALYFNKRGDFTHIGINDENGLVVSKWNDSHVYRHPMLLVPVSFGDTPRFVRGADNNSYACSVLDSL